MITVKKKKTTFLKYPFSQKLQSSSFYVKKLFIFCSQKRSKVWFSLQITFLMCYHHKKIPWDEYPFPQGTIFFFKDPSPKWAKLFLWYIFHQIYMYWYIGLGGWVYLFVYFILCVCVCDFVFLFLFFLVFFWKPITNLSFPATNMLTVFLTTKNDLRIARVSILVIE